MIRSVVEVASVLGWLINNSGTCSNQWNDALRKAWGIFHSNLRVRGWSRLGIQRRLALLDRCVKPFLLHRLQLWGPSGALLKRLARVQRHMVSRALGNFRLPWESFKTFYQRCSRETRSHIGTSISDWACAWASSVVSWDAHLARDWSEQCRFLSMYPLSRPHYALGVDAWHFCNMTHTFATQFSWAASLSRVQDENFFDKIRTTFNNAVGRVSTRTGTRSVKGFVSLRWHDCVKACRTLVDRADEDGPES